MREVSFSELVQRLHELMREGGATLEILHLDDPESLIHKLDFHEQPGLARWVGMYDGMILYSNDLEKVSPEEDLTWTPLTAFLRSRCPKSWYREMTRTVVITTLEQLFALGGFALSCIALAMWILPAIVGSEPVTEPSTLFSGMANGGLLILGLALILPWVLAKMRPSRLEGLKDLEPA